jgi:amidophosphoribosyltransferase
VFDGQYVTGDVSEAYLAMLEARRNDFAKQRRDREQEIFGLSGNDEDESQLSLHRSS